MIVDGLYFTFNLAEKALADVIKLIFGQLISRKPSEDKMSYDVRFKIDNSIEQQNVLESVNY